MPAPPSNLITALRGGVVARHLFFYLDHPSGAVRVWDGIGEMIFGGSTYLGVGGLASIEGLSNSADLQNHSPSVALNRVPLTTLQSNTSNVRNRTATIAVGFFNEAGALIASRTLFTGKGDYLITKITEDEARVTLKLRGKISDWSLAPRAYYTPNDQAALYPSVTDRGLDSVRSLENANVSGWASTVESSGGNIGRVGMMLRDSGTGTLMHATGRGGIICISTGGTYFVYQSRIGLNNLTGQAFEEETSGATTNVASVTGYLNFSGANAYVDSSGDGRSAGGKLIFPVTTSTTQKVKRLATIASNGTATAETVNVASAIFRNGAGTNYDMFHRSTGSLTYGALDTSAAIINNVRGFVFITGSTLCHISNQNTGHTVTSYVEDVTNTAVSISGSRLQVSGVNCVVSTTGVILSSGGRRIKPSGGDSTTDYLRVIS
jgi:hypothetical protein